MIPIQGKNMNDFVRVKPVLQVFFLKADVLDFFQRTTSITFFTILLTILYTGDVN